MTCPRCKSVCPLEHSNVTSKMQRWRLDRDLLLADLEKNPKNTRTAFYLAQVSEHGRAED